MFWVWKKPARNLPVIFLIVLLHCSLSTKVLFSNNAVYKQKKLRMLLPVFLFVEIIFIVLLSIGLLASKKACMLTTVYSKCSVPVVKILLLATDYKTVFSFFISQWFEEKVSICLYKLQAKEASKFMLMYTVWHSNNTMYHYSLQSRQQSSI